MCSKSVNLSCRHMAKSWIRTLNVLNACPRSVGFVEKIKIAEPTVNGMGWEAAFDFTALCTFSFLNLFCFDSKHRFNLCNVNPFSG